MSVDPLAADYASWSPYNYVLGNPVLLIDPDGRSAEKADNEYVKDKKTGELRQVGTTGGDEFDIVSEGTFHDDGSVSIDGSTTEVLSVSTYTDPVGEMGTRAPGINIVAGGNPALQVTESPVELLMSLPKSILTKGLSLLGKKFLGHKAKKQLFEIGDGVRRSKAAFEQGKKTIQAENGATGKLFDVGIDQLRSPLKSSIDVSTPRKLARYKNAAKEVSDGTAAPIYVQPGSRGVKVSDITFKKQ